MTVHAFDVSLARGLRHEQELDRIYGSDFNITEATPSEQRRGIDRWFEQLGRRFSVQYKADDRAADTGNGFIEIQHIGFSYVAFGWLITCRADWLAFYLPPSEVLWFRPNRLRKAAVDTWLKHYPIRSATNAEYQTIGLVVPLRELRKLSKECVA